MNFNDSFFAEMGKIAAFLTRRGAAPSFGSLIPRTPAEKESRTALAKIISAGRKYTSSGVTGKHLSRLEAAMGREALKEERSHFGATGLPVTGEQVLSFLRREKMSPAQAHGALKGLQGQHAEEMRRSLVGGGYTKEQIRPYLAPMASKVLAAERGYRPSHGRKLLTGPKPPSPPAPPRTNWKDKALIAAAIGVPAVTIGGAILQTMRENKAAKERHKKQAGLQKTAKEKKTEISTPWNVILHAGLPLSAGLGAGALSQPVARFSRWAGKRLKMRLAGRTHAPIPPYKFDVPMALAVGGGSLIGSLLIRPTLRKSLEQAEEERRKRYK